MRGWFRFPHLGLSAVVVFAHLTLAQPVLLQIRPHIGDTLRMHLSQSVEMSGTTNRGGRDSSTGSMTTSIEVFTRAIAHQWSSGGTLMQSITDSVAMTPAAPGTLADLKRRTMAKRVWVRVSPDGAMAIVGDDDENSELRHIFGEMPAMLAREPVQVGAKWTREMQIPLSGEPGAMGKVRATFRLDSLGKNGDVAYISMHGTMERSGSRAPTPLGTGYATSGTLSGTIQIDRRLGWITDSRSSIVVRSTIAAAPARKGGPQGAPMQVRTKITQWIRAMRTR